jgi:hypothetical protein
VSERYSAKKLRQKRIAEIAAGARPDPILHPPACAHRRLTGYHSNGVITHRMMRPAFYRCDDCGKEFAFGDGAAGVAVSKLEASANARADFLSELLCRLHGRPWRQCNECSRPRAAR